MRKLRAIDIGFVRNDGRFECGISSFRGLIRDGCQMRKLLARIYWSIRNVYEETAMERAFRH